MKLTCNKEDLLKVAGSVEGIVRNKLNFTHLSNILLTAEENQLSIRANNSEISQVATIEAEIVSPGEIVITQFRLVNLLRSFPDGKMTLEVDDNNVIHITPTETKRKLQAALLGFPADDFPPLVDFPVGPYYVIEKSYLKKMIQKVAFAVSSQPTRYALHGVLFDLQKNQLALVATDTRKLSLFKTILPSEKEENLGVIIPSEVLLHIQKNLSDEGPVNFMIEKNQIFFKFGNLKIASNLINGEFPKYQMLLPKTHDFSLSARTSDIMNAISASNSILSVYQPPKIIWKLSPGKLEIFSQESNYNEVSENLDVEYNGKEMKFGFNARMLLDVIHNIDTDEVVFEFNSETAPVIIKEMGRNESTYVVMPVKLSN